MKCQQSDSTPDPRYLGFFECFNQGKYFEAHEILEELWLEDRSGPDGPFYKGLIQLAGAFVHVQKQRPRPAAALLKLARSNLEPYSPAHYGLELGTVLQIICEWLERCERGEVQDAPTASYPKLHLNDLGA